MWGGPKKGGKDAFPEFVHVVLSNIVRRTHEPVGGSEIAPPGPKSSREGQRSGGFGGFSCLIVVYRELLGRSLRGSVHA